MLYAAWGGRHVHALQYGHETAPCGQSVREVVGGTRTPLPFLAVPTAERCAWCHAYAWGLFSAQ